MSEEKKHINMDRFYMRSWVLLGISFAILTISPVLGVLLFLFGLPVWALIAIKKKNTIAPPAPPPRRIVKTVILSSSQHTKTGSSLGRAALGGALFGGFGAVVGSMTGKTKGKTRFLVLYDDDTRDTIEVVDGSWQYNMLIEYLEA